MSLTFTVSGAAHLTVRCLLDALALDDLEFVRNPAPGPDGPFPATVSHLAWHGRTTRPVEVWTEDDALRVRLLTSGANAASSTLGISLLVAAARLVEAEISDEEGKTRSVEDFLAHYDEDWCTQHALFGLSALEAVARTHPRLFAVMPTNQGALTVASWNLEASAADPEATFSRFLRRAWVGDLAREAPLVEKEGGILARRVALGRRCWVDNTARWIEVQGVQGLVSRERLTSVIGEGVERVDDGCVLLPELSDEQASAMRRELASTAVTDPETWKTVTGIGREPAGTPVDDMQGMDGHPAAVHHEDQIRVLVREKRAAAEGEEAASAAPTDRRQEILTAPDVRVGKRVRLAVGEKDGKDIDLLLVLGSDGTPREAFPVAESDFQVKGVRQVGCATLLAFAPVLPGLVLVALFGWWGLLAAALVTGPALLLALAALIRRDHLVMRHGRRTARVDVSDLGDDTEREALLERLRKGRVVTGESRAAEARRAAVAAAVARLEAENASEEARERKARSIALLESQGVPTIPHLPVVEDSSVAMLPEASEVAKRATLLALVSARAQGLPRDKAWHLIRDFGLEEDLTPEERAFLVAAEPSEQDRIQFGWRGEASSTLLWALGQLDQLPVPVAPTPGGVERLIQGLQQEGPAAFLARAALRPSDEILDAVDQTYRYHWAVRDALLKQSPPPADLHPGVVQERHHSLNWLVGGSAWDEVQTST